MFNNFSDQRPTHHTPHQNRTTRSWQHLLPNTRRSLPRHSAPQQSQVAGLPGSRFLTQLQDITNLLPKTRYQQSFWCNTNHTQPQRLSKAKYQDNLEFIQWMKWQLSNKIKDNGTYNAPARRHNNKINLLFTDQKHFDLRQTVNK